MNFKRSKVATALAAMAGVGGALAMTAVNAQQAPATTTTTQQGTPEIKIEVTGSNIRRVQGEGSLPVTVITRKQIEQTGATSVPELLQKISSNSSQNSTSLANSVGAATFSAQTASLRGLGGQFTLVLLNGHRIEGFPGEIQGVAGVNLAGIPFDAIERVEILKDGASAIYGSDAIAGVINFITRDDYTGAEVTGQYGTPTRSGGGDQYSGSGSFGIGSLDKDRYNFFGTVSYREQKPLDQRDRDFSDTGFRNFGLFTLSSNTNPGNITTGGIGPVLNGKLCGPGNTGHNTYFNDPNFGLVGCYYDPARTPGVQMIPDDKLTNAFAKATFQLSDNWQAYVTGLYAHDETKLAIQPSPVSSVFPWGPGKSQSGAITLQPDSPYYPHDIAAQFGVDGEPLNVRYRTFDAGLRTKTDTNDQGSAYAGLKGSIGDWDVEGSGYYNEGKTVEHLDDGYFDYRIMQPLLNSGTINFFGPNTPATIAAERSSVLNIDAVTDKAKSYGADVKASGEIFKLPAGSVAVAVGAGARKETLDQEFPPVVIGGYVSGYGGSLANVSASRKQYDGFGEINIPIVKTLEADAAVRYDHYSDFGGTTNPKVSLRWQPTKELLFRGSYGHGFVAPSLFQLYQPPITGVSQSGLSDPIRCPVTGNTGIDCKTQFGVTFGGNPNLKPQRSEQIGAGVVYEPVPGASVSVDYFKINVSDFILDGIAPAIVLGDLAKYGNLVHRGPVDPNFPSLPGPITAIDSFQLNLAGVHIQGLDIDLRYRAPEQSWGRLTFELQGTYYLRYDTSNPDGSFTGGVSNTYGSPSIGVVPRWKHYATLTWDRGPWSTTLAQTFQDSYTDAGVDFSNYLQRTVGTMSIWDLNTTYSGFKNTKITVGVKNLLDTNPPQSNQTGSFIGGFDPSYYDPLARFVYLSVNYKFK